MVITQYFLPSLRLVEVVAQVRAALAQTEVLVVVVLRLLRQEQETPEATLHQKEITAQRILGKAVAVVAVLVVQPQIPEVKMVLLVVLVPLHQFLDHP